MSESNQKLESGSIVKAQLRRIVQKREFLLVIIVAAMFVFLSLTTPFFLTWQNLRTVLSSMSTDGIIVIGMTILFIAGGFDLSVGSVMCLAMVICALMFRSVGLGIWESALIAIAFCAVIGWIIGMLVTKIKLNHFIVTLCFMGIARGLVFALSGGTNISLVAQLDAEPAFQFIGNGTVFGFLPTQVLIFIVVAIIADFLVRRTSIMRLVFYTGSNPRAAEYSGIRTHRIIIGAGIVCSICAGIAGVIFLSRFSGVPLTAGTGLEMVAISACVIGGASLKGGKGSILGSILGLAFMVLVTNAMIMFGIRAHWQDLIRFSILLAVVAMDQIGQNIAQKKAQ